MRGHVELATGSFPVPRTREKIEDPRCRFCGHSCETIVHLLDACPDTAAYCVTHGISFDTLVNETQENILRIAHFDASIWRARPWMSLLAFQSQFGHAKDANDADLSLGAFALLKLISHKKYCMGGDSQTLEICMKK